MTEARFLFTTVPKAVNFMYLNSTEFNFLDSNYRAQEKVRWIQLGLIIGPRFVIVRSINFLSGQWELAMDN